MARRTSGIALTVSAPLWAMVFLTVALTASPTATPFLIALIGCHEVLPEYRRHLRQSGIRVTLNADGAQWRVVISRRDVPSAAGRA
jgi:hypothetical protein